MSQNLSKKPSRISSLELSQELKAISLFNMDLKINVNTSHQTLWNNLTWTKIKNKVPPLDAKMSSNLLKKLLRIMLITILLAQLKLTRRDSYKSESRINLLRLKSTNLFKVFISLKFQSKRLLLTFHHLISPNKCTLVI